MAPAAQQSQELCIPDTWAPCPSAAVNTNARQAAERWQSMAVAPGPATASRVTFLPPKLRLVLPGPM